MPKAIRTGAVENKCEHQWLIKKIDHMNTYGDGDVLYVDYSNVVEYICGKCKEVWVVDEK